MIILLQFFLTFATTTVIIITTSTSNSTTTVTPTAMPVSIVHVHIAFGLVEAVVESA